MIHTKTIHYTVWAIRAFCIVTKTYWRIHVGCNVASILKELQGFPSISQLNSFYSNAWELCSFWFIWIKLSEIEIMYSHLLNYAFACYSVSELRNFKKFLHIQVMTLLKGMPKFFCVFGDESAVRLSWQKNTAGRWHRLRGGHVAADQAPAWWSLDFSRIPSNIRIYSKFRLAQTWTCDESSKVTIVQVKECLYMTLIEKMGVCSG
jgi:hypothetical protein